MSELGFTATFVRMGRAPFGTKAKEATVFAQHLAGGRGLTIFTDLHGPGPTIRIESVGSAQTLMAGFALAASSLPIPSAPGLAAVVEELRAAAATGHDLSLDPSDADLLADAVQQFDVALIVCSLGRSVDLDPALFSPWTVQHAIIDL